MARMTQKMTADRALISKPAFVQQINLLQREVGFELFVRTNRGVTPTKAGAEFARVATQALDMLGKGLATCQQIARQDDLAVRIGYDPTEVAPFLGDICNALRVEEPPVAIEFVESPYPKQFEALAHGLIDACFFSDSSLIDELGLAFENLYEDGQCCCMSPHDALASRPLIEPADLAGQRLYIEPVYTHEAQTVALLRWLQDNDIAVEIDGRAFDASLPAHILVHGGIIPVPQRYIADCVPPLKAIPLAWPKTRYGVVHRPQPTPGVRRLIEAARNYFASDFATLAQAGGPAAYAAACVDTPNAG